VLHRPDGLLGCLGHAREVGKRLGPIAEEKSWITKDYRKVKSWIRVFVSALSIVEMDSDLLVNSLVKGDIGLRDL